MAELADPGGTAASWASDQFEEAEAGGERVWLDQKHSRTEAEQAARSATGELGISVCGCGLQLGPHEKVVSGGGCWQAGGGGVRVAGRKKEEKKKGDRA